jgi:hypothetical protein
MTLVAVLLLPLLLLVAIFLGHHWAYWSRRSQAESYISQIEKFKLEHGSYPDPRTQTIVPFFSPFSYGTDGQQYCVGFMIYFDDDYHYCSTNREWAFGLGQIFDWPTGPWPPAPAVDEK